MTDVPGPHILLADDHGLIRDALPGAIRRAIPRATFLGVGTAAETIAAVERESWALVVLDLGLPGSDGEFTTLQRIHAIRPTMPILVLTMFSEEKFGVAAIEAGASGYLVKTADRATVAAAAAATLAGRGYRSPQLSALLADREAAGPRGVAALSSRERDVMQQLARGASNKQISAHLKVGVSTVATYRTRLMSKLGLRTTAELLRYIVEHRLKRD